MLSLAIAGVLVLVLIFGAALAAVVVGFLVSGSDGAQTVLDRLGSEAFFTQPAGFLANNLLLAALIPTAAVAVRVGHGWRPRWLSSVVPGLRWGWLVECSLWSTIVVGALFGLSFLVDGAPDWSPEPQLALYVAIVVLTTPLQAAGEEYAFRGLLTQAIGSWLPRAGAAAVVGGLVSASLFALAHGSQSPWLFGDRFAFGAVASYVVWRTGGLEASIALHAVNNLYAIGFALATGALADTVTAQEYPPAAAFADAVLLLVFAGIVTWRARRRRLVRLHDPARQPDRTRAGKGFGVGDPAR
jgi:membrane protease YdiL (CAAX protease family)